LPTHGAWQEALTYCKNGWEIVANGSEGPVDVGCSNLYDSGVMESSTEGKHN